MSGSTKDDGEYEQGDVIGKGTYGTVHRARNRRTQQVVALKHITLSSADEGVPCTAVREISLLRELHHSNIIRLIDVLYSLKKLTLVFEYVETDLKEYMERAGNIVAASEAKVRHIG